MSDDIDRLELLDRDKLGASQHDQDLYCSNRNGHSGKYCSGPIEVMHVKTVAGRVGKVLSHRPVCRYHAILLKARGVKLHVV